MKPLRILIAQTNRRSIQISLGILWLLDGVLQLQPQMFGSNFANRVIAPAALGQPLVISGPMTLEVHILAHYPAFFGAIFALVQLSLGALILWKRTTRIGLIASVAWGLGVWYFGEGLAGMLGGQASILMGAPGAALLYVAIAIAVLPLHKSEAQGTTSNNKPAYWLIFFWSAIWIAGAIFQLLPGQDTSSDVSLMISSNANGAPGWLAFIDTHVAHAISSFGANAHQMAGMHMTVAQMAGTAGRHGSGSGFWFILVLAATQALIGLSVLLPGYIRQVGIAAGIVLSICFWVVGQSLGGYFTGVATDLGSAPLFVLLGIMIVCISASDFAFEKEGPVVAPSGRHSVAHER